MSAAAEKGRGADKGGKGMLVFHEQRLVILSVPKTASTSIETALADQASIVVREPPLLRHTTMYRYRRQFQSFLERGTDLHFTVVAMMREPVSWLGSWYRYRQRDDVAHTVRSTRGISFDDFLRSYLGRPPAAFADVGSQVVFLDGGRKPGPDYLFAYEDIGGFLKFLEGRLERRIELPRLNSSPEMAPGTVLDISPEMRAALQAAMPRDFALYDQLRSGQWQAAKATGDDAQTRSGQKIGA